MKYRTVKKYEVIPRNAETFNGVEWIQYYDEYDYIETKAETAGTGTLLHLNYIINEDEIRVPIEESEVTE